MTSLVQSVNPVNTVSSTNNIEDIKKLYKYVGGQSLKEKPDTFTSSAKSAVSGAAMWEGIPLARFLIKKGIIKKSGKIANTDFAKEAMGKIGEANAKAMENLAKGSGKLGKRIMDFMQTSEDSVAAYRSVRGAVAAQSAEIKAVKKGGEKLLTKAASKSSAKVKAAETAIEKIGKTASEVKLGKVGTYINKVTKGKFAPIGKACKASGAGVMLALSGVIEGTTEVVPTFKELGFKKGMKQTGKSAVKVAGDTFGYIAGSKIGTAAGTWAGTWAATKIAAAAGTSVCPGIGTAIGAACGLVCGLLGSFIMGKITKKITGKSEREKAKEAEQQKQIEQIAKDENALKELKELAAQKIEAELDSKRKVSKDTKIALQAYANLNTENPFV